MKVKLRIRANNLQLGTFRRRKLNPFCEVILIGRSYGNDGRQQRTVIGKTETISNTKNPYWLKHFELDYKISQDLYFEVGVYHEYEDDDGINRTSLVSEYIETTACMKKILDK